MMNSELLDNRHLYYNRQGEPIELTEWAKLLENENYKVVKQECIGEYLVSTVWVGLNMSAFLGNVAIFETMIFSNTERCQGGLVTGHPFINYQARYSTEEQALEGHARAVQMVKDSVASESRSAPEAPGLEGTESWATARRGSGRQSDSSGNEGRG